jgi:hypothetical protein
VIGKKGYDLMPINQVKKPSKACLLLHSSWSLCAVFLHTRYRVGHFWKEEGFITYYQTRVGQRINGHWKERQSGDFKSFYELP